MEAHKRIIIALDQMSREQAFRLISELGDLVGGFKIGLVQIHAEESGRLIDRASGYGGIIFYDAKLLDISRTVSDAMGQILNRLPEGSLVNLHATGGRSMMQEAARTIYAMSRGNNYLKLIAVTLLTSLSYEQLYEVGLVEHVALEPVSSREGRQQQAIENKVVKLALLARECGLQGIVASPREVKAVRGRCGPDFLIVTPGVRSVGVDQHDQSRVATPGTAVKNGADFIVVGREITQASDPRAAVERIVRDIDTA